MPTSSVEIGRWRVLAFSLSPPLTRTTQCRPTPPTITSTVTGRRPVIQQVSGVSLGASDTLAGGIPRKVRASLCHPPFSAALTDGDEPHAEYRYS